MGNVAPSWEGDGTRLGQGSRAGGLRPHLSGSISFIRPQGRTSTELGRVQAQGHQAHVASLGGIFCMLELLTRRQYNEVEYENPSESCWGMDETPSPGPGSHSMPSPHHPPPAPRHSRQLPTHQP